MDESLKALRYHVGEIERWSKGFRVERFAGDHYTAFDAIIVAATPMKETMNVLEQLEEERKTWQELKAGTSGGTRTSMDGTIHGLSIAIRILKNNSDEGNE